MKSYNFGPVVPITFKEVKRLYGQGCQIRTVHSYWILGHGWIEAKFPEATPQPAPVVAIEAAPQPEAPKGPQLSEVEQILAQFSRMEKLTRNHARLKEVMQELDQFNFSPSEEVNNPIELVIKDRNGHKFETMNVTLIQPMLQFLQGIVNGLQVETEEKLLRFKATA